MIGLEFVKFTSCHRPAGVVIHSKDLFTTEILQGKTVPFQ